MRAGSDDLKKQVARLLRRRPGWSLQTLPTPGAPPVWCFGSKSAIDLSVTVDSRTICVFVVDTEQDVTMRDVDGLVEWLKANQAGSLEDPTIGIVDRLKKGKLFQWE